MEWNEIAALINKEFRGEDESLYRTEAAYRKPYQQSKRFYEAGVFNKLDEESYMKELQLQKRELERMKVQYRDERRSWSKQNYADSRVDETMEIIEDIIPSISHVEFPIHINPEIDYGKHMIVCLSDLHIGQTFKSFWGEYNTSIARDRLTNYLNEILRIQKVHGVSDITVASLGDHISGLIHQTIQITNKEDVVEQVKIAIELITSFCYELTNHFKNVWFYNIPGNHSRLNPNKDQALKNERLDDLIGWTVCNLLKHQDNFHNMMGNNIDSTIGIANICGEKYVLIHGDMDSITKSGIGNLVTMLGFIPRNIITAHRHTPSMNEFNGITVYQSGSIPGSGDDHTISNRLSGKPSQTVLICNEHGVECCYNISLL